MDWRPKAGQISTSRYVLVDDRNELLAIGLMRFPLNQMTETDGGNLSCYVPPALRNRGFGSYCLALLLFEAVRSGLRRALVTCQHSDPIAAKIIIKNRGQLSDTCSSADPRRPGELIDRYWISFGPQ